jgi:hypothetical protein
MLAKDIDEIKFLKENVEIIDLLLQDKTTNKNIIWATDNYLKKGIPFGIDKPILSNLIMRKGSKVIKPRIEKSKAEQTRRSKDKAEVFTPSWICNKQNNLIDDAWFGRNNVFNLTSDESNNWVATNDIIRFPEDKVWKDYVKETRLEMCCGEAPYLVSRYDTVSGEMLELKDRVGMLDRKFRIINENAKNDEEWNEQAFIALKSIYGYEFQGDNLYIARCNVLLTFIDYFKGRYNKDPDIDLIKQAIDIICWNVWQMDGLKLVVPFSCHKEGVVQISLFSDMPEEPQFCLGCRNGNPKDHNGKRCFIMDWEKREKVKYVDVLWRG